MCLVIESGFWFIESGVTIPVELVVHQHPARLLPSCQCQHPARLFYQHLGFFREVFPVGCCSSCWFIIVTPVTPVAVDRSPSPTHCDRDRFCSDRRVIGCSRQLSRQCVADPWWWILDGGFYADIILDGGSLMEVFPMIWNLMKVDGRFTRDMSVWWIFSLIANLLGLSICQRQYVSWWNRFHLYMKSNEVQR